MARASKGGGSVYPLGDGRWRAQWDYGIVAGKRIRKTRTCRPPDAQRKARAALADLQRGAIAGILPDTATTGEWVTYWLDLITKARPTTKDGYRSKIDTHIIPTVGHIRLQDLRPDHVRAMQDTMRSRGLAPNTIKQAHAILSAALRVAVDEGRIQRNPAAVRSASVTGAHNPHPIVQLQDASRIVNAARDPSTQARLMAALWLGLRQSEALGLSWSDVHETAPVPHVEVRQVARRLAGEGMVLQEPKSAASRRLTPMSPAVAAVFAAWRLDSGGRGYVWPSPSGGLGDPRADADLWRDALTRAGVTHVPLHGARGTAATIMLMDTPLHIVARYLGHSNPMVTLAHYARVMDGQLGAAADALERRMLEP